MPDAERKNKLGLINIILIGLISLLCITLIFDVITSFFNFKKEGGFIYFNGYDEKQSREIYDRYLKKKGNGYDVLPVYDYGLYGHYLHLNQEKIVLPEYTSFSSLALYNIDKEIISLQDVNYSFDGKNNILNGGIDLFSLDEGNYLVLSSLVMNENLNGPFTGLKVVSYDFDITIFSLPENGVRKKVQIQNQQSSPNLVIKVSKVSFLPSAYYDLILIGEKEACETYRESLPDNLAVKITSSLGEAYKSNTTLALYVGDEAFTTSKYYSSDINKDDVVVDDIRLLNADKNDYIRELGGYLTLGGSASSSYPSSFEIIPYQKYHQGKITFLVNSEVSFEKIKEIY